MDESSPLIRLCEELIALRERTDRQHKFFEAELAHTREELQGRFDHFASDVQSAYQRLREELTSEKRLTLTLLNTLIDQALDFERLARSGGSDAVGVAARAARDALAHFGVHHFRPEPGE